jgi:hypothetical protein
MSVVATFRRLAGTKRNLRTVGARIVNEVQEAMNAQILDAVDVMHSEPPLKIGSSYIRSHRYSSSWRPILAHPSGGRLEGGIAGNAVDSENFKNYTMWVGGDEYGGGQQQQHYDTGWPVAALALEGLPTGSGLRRAKPFVDRVRKAVRKAVRG